MDSDIKNNAMRTMHVLALDWIFNVSPKKLAMHIYHVIYKMFDLLKWIK